MLECLDKGYGVGRVSITVDMFQDVNLDVADASSSEADARDNDDSDDASDNKQYDLIDSLLSI